MFQYVFTISNFGSVKLVAFIITIIGTIALTCPRCSSFCADGAFRLFSKLAGAILTPRYSLVIRGHRIS
jgi:hypothetical protein